MHTIIMIRATYNGPDPYDLDYDLDYKQYSSSLTYKREGATTSVLTMVKKMTIVIIMIKNMNMVVLVVLFKRVGTTTTAPTHTHRTRTAPLLRGILCTSSASPSSSSSSSSLSSSSSRFNYIMAIIFNNIILIITAAGPLDKSACVCDCSGCVTVMGIRHSSFVPASRFQLACGGFHWIWNILKLCQLRHYFANFWKVKHF